MRAITGVLGAGVLLGLVAAIVLALTAPAPWFSLGVAVSAGCLIALAIVRRVGADATSDSASRRFAERSMDLGYGGDSTGWRLISRIEQNGRSEPQRSEPTAAEGARGSSCAPDVGEGSATDQRPRGATEARKAAPSASAAPGTSA